MSILLPFLICLSASASPISQTTLSDYQMVIGKALKLTPISCSFRPSGSTFGTDDLPGSVAKTTTGDNLSVAGALPLLELYNESGSTKQTFRVTMAPDFNTVVSVIFERKTCSTSTSDCTVQATADCELLNTPYGDIKRNTDGSVHYDNLVASLKGCGAYGQHLPTAREFAQIAASMGAAGISETAKDGYHFVNGRTSDGKSDSFYYSNLGYKTPTSDLGNNEFWSSSWGDHSDTNVYSFDGKDGDIREEYRNFLNASFCARGL